MKQKLQAKSSSKKLPKKLAKKKLPIKKSLAKKLSKKPTKQQLKLFAKEAHHPLVKVDRNLKVVSLFYGLGNEKPHTNAQIAKKFKITESRIPQIIAHFCRVTGFKPEK